MRVLVGTIAGLGLAVTVAAAQERAAVLKAPVPMPADQMPPVARGAAEGFPPPSGFELPSTPLKRAGSGPGAAGGPAWLGGADPNVLPAGGAAQQGGGVRQLTPASSKEGATQPKFIDRLKGTGEKPPPAGAPVRRVATPPAPPHPEAPTAESPFRGTGANGAPVYAGPPAYRWYGWGTVTPGANPLAPAGQYPKASANWYSITGATPGAFPVPISNGVPVAPGTEPPNYGLARSVPAPPAVPVAERQTAPQVIVHPQFHPQPAPQPVSRPLPKPEAQSPRPEVHQTPAPPESKFMPGTSLGASLPTPVRVPTITPPPAPNPVAVAAPAAPTLKPEAVATKPLAAPPVIPVPPVPAPRPEAVAVLPPPPAIPAVPPVIPAKPALPTIEPKTAAAEPKPLPTSVRTEPPREQPQWQPATEPTTPPPGTWAPAQGVQPLPTIPAGTSPRVGSANMKPVVARGQMGDARPDPVAALIKQVCQGRAEGLEVRHTGTKKLQVCFEVPSATAAKQIVNDISKRRELTAYQIDFCVLVK